MHQTITSRRHAGLIVLTISLIVILGVSISVDAQETTTELDPQQVLDECIEEVVAYNDAQGTDPEPAPEPVEFGPVTDQELQLAVPAEDLEGLASGDEAIRANASAALVGRTITLDGEPIDLEVPGPGLIAGVDRVGVDGHVPSALQICNPGNGTLTVEISQEASSGVEGQTLASHTPCTQAGNAFVPSRKQTAVVNWHYNNSGGQSHITTSEFASIVKSGFDGMLTGRNDCGFGDPISLSATRVGSTTAGTGGTNDGVNAMGWGPLTGYIGYTYWWSNGSRTTEFDIRFSNDAVNDKLAESIGSTCDHSYHFAGLALHEVMHGYGFEHTSSNLQTMYTTMSRCSTNWYTMGKGDWDGVNARY